MALASAGRGRLMLSVALVLPWASGVLLVALVLTGVVVAIVG